LWILRSLYVSSVSFPWFYLWCEVGCGGDDGGRGGREGLWNKPLTDIHQVENEQRDAQIPSKQGTSPEQTSALEESIFKLSGQLSTITRNQKYFRTRENRNFSTVRSTERRIFNLSVIESLMMMCMAGLQVFIVRFFFQVGDPVNAKGLGVGLMGVFSGQGARKGYV
jgi:hypothetical protein